MLTQETKRHIDAARQVLVGVVPNPSSQIDQITNALIYKFMDDMDQSAIKAGGEPSFFVGNLERYAWTRLMDSRLGNQERMNLYSEALIKFSEAKQFPELFRGIFKSAFLPYRSPEVLGLFLKEIEYFDYSHSEELGNAYEYLLSIMGSQGDAGQFRTPRHIIDFIVAAVNPTKDDKVLDPACGTAGFLVSAYRHILEQHDGKNPDGYKNKEKPLTPDQHRALMNNFEGYDVDPGMVRISQVNMYLHHFRNPKIYNYNTLSQEERWADKFDVILANPPFMSPKGGVSTHNKFSVPSTRSEVLFVDYIMNHLRPKGRAGIIVPEGIIFQSGNAHKQLRKNLVEDGLYAVVSLPSGVFQPYSGVKTSILLFNNELAKRSAELLFIKIENDGFDLGATKRPINKNDLPQAVEIINVWKDGKKLENNLAMYVEKTKIAENGDYNLSGDRYRVATDYSNAKWPMVELGEVCDVRDGTHDSPKQVQEGYPLITSKNIKDGELDFSNVSYISEEDFKKISQRSYVDVGDIIMPMIGTIGGACLIKSKEKEFAIKNVALFKKSKQIVPEYLLNILDSDLVASMFENQAAGATQKFVSLGVLRGLKLPLPPLEIQQQIVAELDWYRNIITGARQIVENWKPKIDIEPEWEKVKLPAISENNDNKRKPVTKSDRSSGQCPYYGASGVVDYVEDYIFDGDYLLISEDGANLLARSTPIAFSISGKSWVNNHAHILKFKNSNTQKFVEIYINQIDISNFVTGMAQPKLNQQALNTIEIPLPPLEIQKQIVENIETERALVESAKKLIEIYEQKTKDVLSKLWAE
ncbi:MAG: N-6 DNA methylase [Elusimicrobiota bacterium]